MELLSDVISTEALPANNTPEEQAKIELQQYIDDSISPHRESSTDPRS